MTDPITSSKPAIDQQRRKILKAAGGVSAFTAAPVLAASSLLPEEASVTAQELDGITEAVSEWVEIRFVDSKSVEGFYALGQGTIINRSHHDVLISDLVPNVITTENASYNVSAYLAENPVRINAGSQHHFWVRPLEAMDAIGRQARLRSRVKPHGQLPLDGTVQARVNLNIESPRIAVGSNRMEVSVKLRQLIA